MSFNVLKGDMSFVGPRPLVEKNFITTPKEIKDQIYLNKPGITGIGSVVFRDEEKLISETDLPPEQFYNEIIGPYKCDLEIWYGNNISFITDLKILILTVLVILSPNTDLYKSWFKDLPKAKVF